MATLYKPYFSESESESSDSDGYTSEESLLRITNVKNPVEVVGTGVYDSILYQSSFSETTKFESEESKNTSLFMINSRDRDNKVYPQPTFFTIRLPHVYKNIKTVNITQINLLNSFFNFSLVNGNTNMYVLEEGRLPISVSIREGTYGVNDLVSEISNALNSTPLFAQITFTTFFNGFQTSGDYSPLFNTPGPVVYNSLTQTYDSNVTLKQIVGRYFQQLYSL